ncbi:MAG: transposase, partial [Oscillospiraceae bacterium]|nr:transposase [Oscillospiraceae bacterium]
ATNKAVIDFGIDNIATIVTTDGSSKVYKGGAIISENRLFAKEKAKATAIITKGTKRKHAASKHLDYLSCKHDCFMLDQLHKISRSIVDYCVAHEVGTLVIGKNVNWKQEVNLGKVNNQNFVSIPHAKLEMLIRYKAELEGIEVIVQEESYTSKADVTVNDEIPFYKDGQTINVAFSGRRIKRGLYRTASGLVINADCNGAANILRKAYPDVWNTITDFSFLAHPESVNFKKLNERKHA